MRKSTKLLCVVIPLISLAITCFVPQTQAASVAQGRALLFGDGVVSYSGLIAANNEFKAVVQAEPSNQEANFFYAITRVLVFALEQPNAPGFAAVETLGDLFGAFGMLRGEGDYPAVDDPFVELPVIYDDYAPPGTLPGGATMQQFWGGACLTVVNQAIANLESITAALNITLSPGETGDTAIEIDDGDLLALKAALYTFKSLLLIGISYDFDISAPDLQRLISLGSGDLFQIQKDLLDAYPDVFKKQGSDSLSEARTALLQGIIYYRNAIQYITSTETDYQGNDLLYFDTKRDEHTAKHILNLLTELEGSLTGNVVGTFTENEQTWQLSFNGGTGSDQLYVVLDTDGNLVDGHTWYSDVDDFEINGTSISFVLVMESPFITITHTCTGTLSGDAITGGTYTATDSLGNTFPGTFTGTRTCNKTNVNKLDANYLFGNTGKAKLDLSAVLPEFDQYNAPKPDTFPPTDDSSHVLNGLFPESVTNDDMTKLLDLEPVGNFNVPTIPPGAISIDGSPADWQGLGSIASVFEDVSGDGSPNKVGTDLKRLFLAQDGTDLYVAMELHDGDPDQTGTSFTVGYRPTNDAFWTNHTYAFFDSGSGFWIAGTMIYGAIPASGYAAAGTKFLEWKVPLSDMIPAGTNWNGSYVSADIWVPGDEHMCSTRKYWEYNSTGIQLDASTTISGTVACPAYTSGDIGITAYDGPDWRTARRLGSTHRSGPGPYVIDGLPDPSSSYPVYLFAVWDKDKNGIRTLGDYYQPLLVNVANTTNPGVDFNLTEQLDTEIMTKPGQYRLFGTNTYFPEDTPYYTSWNPNNVNWGMSSDWTFIGEANTTQTFTASEYFQTILMIWHEDSDFYFDSIQDLTASTTFDHTGGHLWATAGLWNHENFKFAPDGMYAGTFQGYGYNLFAMPSDAAGNATPRQLKVTFDQDTDKDGLRDGLESVNGTDPNNRDTDGDGMPDGWEVDNSLNPLANDTAGDFDGDTRTNIEEYVKKSFANIPDNILTITGSIKHVVRSGVSYALSEIEINEFSGIAPGDIDSISVALDGVDMGLTKADFIWDTSFNEFYMSVPGVPALGTYTFTVTAGT